MAFVCCTIWYSCAGFMLAITPATCSPPAPSVRGRLRSGGAATLGAVALGALLLELCEGMSTRRRRPLTS